MFSTVDSTWITSKTEILEKYYIRVKKIFFVIKQRGKLSGWSYRYPFRLLEALLICQISVLLLNNARAISKKKGIIMKVS